MDERFTDFHLELSRLFKRYMLKKGLTSPGMGTVWLASDAGVSVENLRGILSGEVLPQMRTLEKLFGALACNEDEEARLIALHSHVKRI